MNFKFTRYLNIRHRARATLITIDRWLIFGLLLTCDPGGGGSVNVSLSWVSQLSGARADSHSNGITGQYSAWVMINDARQIFNIYSLSADCGDITCYMSSHDCHYSGLVWECDPIIPAWQSVIITTSITIITVIIIIITLTSETDTSPRCIPLCHWVPILN